MILTRVVRIVSALLMLRLFVRVVRLNLTCVSCVPRRLRVELVIRRRWIEVVVFNFSCTFGSLFSWAWLDV